MVWFPHSPCGAPKTLKIPMKTQVSAVQGFEIIENPKENTDFDSGGDQT